MSVADYQMSNFERVIDQLTLYTLITGKKPVQTIEQLCKSLKDRYDAADKIVIQREVVMGPDGPEVIEVAKPSSLRLNLLIEAQRLRCKWSRARIEEIDI